MAREPVVTALGNAARWAYEATMVALALVVVALLPLPDQGWVRDANLTVWAVFVAAYAVRLALSTDRSSRVEPPRGATPTSWVSRLA